MILSSLFVSHFSGKHRLTQLTIETIVFEYAIAYTMIECLYDSNLLSQFLFLAASAGDLLDGEEWQ
jgi:uncharacterized membrane protein YcaP (DUF421 family)